MSTAPTPAGTPLAPFAVVGSSVTAIDVGLFTALRWAGAGVIAADVPALAVATGVSWALHRQVTFASDPYRRWLDSTPEFVGAALLGGAVDVACAAVLTRAGLPTMAAKLPAVAAAAVVRWRLHRRLLFEIVRSDHVANPERAPSPGDLRLSVVIPAYGEEARIADTIGQVRAALAGLNGASEIIVVDDGSPDRTAEAARAAGADQVFVHERNRGKGAAVRTGALAARGRAVAFTDADLAYAPEQLVGLLTTLDEGWDMVVGSRRHEGTTTLVRARRLREIGGRGINWLTRAVLLGRYRDTQCGLKAFRADAVPLLFSRSRIDRFAFDVELFVVAERNGLAVREVPVMLRNSPRSTVKVVRDAVQLTRDLFRVRRWAREGWYQPAAARRPL